MADVIPLDQIPEITKRGPKSGTFSARAREAVEALLASGGGAVAITESERRNFGVVVCVVNATQEHLRFALRQRDGQNYIIAEPRS